MWRPINESELHLYVDGRLPPRRARDVENYLAANPDEEERLRAYFRQNALLRALATEIKDSLPEAGARRLKGMIEAHVTRARRRRQWGTATAALVFAALLGAAGERLASGTQSAAMGAKAIPVSASR